MELKKLKILHTNFHHGWGGQSNRILMECKGLCEKGHDVTISAPDDSELVKRAELLGIKTFRRAQYSRGFRPIGQFKDVRALVKLINEEKFDIVHTHGSQDSWAVFFAMSFVQAKNKPALFRTKHNIFPITDHIVNRIHYKRFDSLICISNSITDYCKSKSWLSHLKYYLIYSAVDPKPFEEAIESKIREEYNLKGKILAGVVGRLRSEKGHIHLINAIPEIVKEFPEARFIFIGDGSMKEELMSEISKRSISNYVIFAGFRKNVPEILKSLDLFILPSISEGLGTAIIEAGFAGLGAVASNVGGIPDIIDDNENGFLFACGDSKALSEKIKFLLKNPDKYKNAGKKLKEKCMSLFTPEILADKTEKAYYNFLKLN